MKTSAKHIPMFKPSVKYMVEFRPSGQPDCFFNFLDRGFDSLEAAHDALKRNRKFLCEDSWVTEAVIEARVGEAFIYKVETKVTKVSVCPPLTFAEVKNHKCKELRRQIRELNKQSKKLEATARKTKAAK